MNDSTKPVQDKGGFDSKLYEEATLSFVVKIWLEEATATAESTWRGQITHVPSGRQQGIRKLNEITAFVASYIESHRGESMQ